METAMTSDQTVASPYEIVLADLKAKRAQIDQAIAAIEAIVLTGATSTSTMTAQAAMTAQAHVVPPTAVTPGMFLGQTIADAARKVLEINKKAMGTKEIMDAIVAGGVHLSGSTPLNTVQTVLGRQTDIVKVGRGIWALAVWYPNSGRFKKAKSGPDQDVDAEKGESKGETPKASSKSETKAIEQSPGLKVVH